MDFKDFKKFIIKTITPEGVQEDTNILVDIDTIYLSNNKDNAVYRLPYSGCSLCEDEIKEYIKNYIELCYKLPAFQDSRHDGLTINESKEFIRMKYQRLNITHQRPYISNDKYFKYPLWNPEDENPTC